MANDKKNLSRLVTEDDDPTVELEALILPTARADADLESTSSTAGFSEPGLQNGDQNESVAALKTDLLSRSETIDKVMNHSLCVVVVRIPCQDSKD